MIICTLCTVVPVIDLLQCCVVPLSALWTYSLTHWFPLLSVLWTLLPVHLLTYLLYLYYEYNLTPSHSLLSVGLLWTQSHTLSFPVVVFWTWYSTHAEKFTKPFKIPSVDKQLHMLQHLVWKSRDTWEVVNRSDLAQHWRKEGLFLIP